MIWEKSRENGRVDNKGRFTVKQRLEGGEGISYAHRWGGEGHY